MVKKERVLGSMRGLIGLDAGWDKLVDDENPRE